MTRDVGVPRPRRAQTVQETPDRTGRDEWLEERRTGYGATDVPVLVDGDNKAWNEMHARKLGLLPERDATETMELGRLLEEPIARMVANRLGVQLVRVGSEDRPKILRHPEIPIVMATLDRRRKRGGRPVEIKKWGWRTDDFGRDGSDQIPERMFLQVQQQLAVTGKDGADLGVLFAGSSLGMFKISRDEGTIDEIIALQVENWAYVARGEIPPWPGPAPERPALKADEAEPDDEIIELLQELEAAKAAAARQDEIENQIRERLEAYGGTRGAMPDGRPFSISYRPNRPGTTTAWKDVAAGYRKRLIEMGVPENEVDRVSTALTVPSAPKRPLRVTIKDPSQ